MECIFRISNIGAVMKIVTNIREMIDVSTVFTTKLLVRHYIWKVNNSDLICT